MPYKEHQIEKIYFTVGEVADKLDIYGSKIRFWLDELEIPIRRNHKGERKFTVENVKLLEKIKELREVEHYQMQGIKKKLPFLITQIKEETKKNTTSKQKED